MNPLKKIKNLFYLYGFAVCWLWIVAVNLDWFVSVLNTVDGCWYGSFALGWRC
jgi:hypothetical protein